MLIALLLAALVQAPPPTEPTTPSIKAASADDAEYSIGAGDVLEVKVFGYEDLTQSVVVQPDGAFIFPLLGAVEAADKTASDLARHMQSRLADGFVRNPHVAVVVKEVRSKRVFVVGEIARPGAYPVSEHTTLVEILARSGPLTANAGSEIIVVRRGAEVPRDGVPPQSAADNVHVDVSRLQAGDMTQNAVLGVNDTVMVPPAPRVFVTGEVRAPGAYAFHTGMTVRELIGLAGGFTEDGTAGRISAQREVDGKTRSTKLKLEDPVRPGETIEVKARLF